MKPNPQNYGIRMRPSQGRKGRQLVVDVAWSLGLRGRMSQLRGAHGSLIVGELDAFGNCGSWLVDTDGGSVSTDGG